MDSYQPTPGTTLKRLPKRGSFDRATIHRILDEAFLCHIGFIAGGKPVVIPAVYGRSGETLYIHGSAASRMVRSLASGADACVTVTITDALVMARSAFHHSINYRSVVIFGQARLVTDPQEKMSALRSITDHIAPGRWAEVREPDARELNATSVVAMPIEEVSAKIRTGPPADDDEDLARDVWAGIVPLTLAAGVPVPDEHTAPGSPVSPSVAGWRRP